MGDNAYFSRHLQSILRSRAETEPVIILNGPRTSGKSTLLKEAAADRKSQVIDLDDLETRRLVRADPTFVVRRAGPVFIDEFQHVPELLDAVKAELNRGLTPGRFMLTGSTSYESMPLASQSLTGRAHLMQMWPLSQGEMLGQPEMFLTRLMSDPSRLLTQELSLTTRRQYEDRVLRGGLPIAVRRNEQDRRRWFRDYVQLVVERDVLELRKVRQREVIPVLLRHLVGQTAQVLNVRRIAEQLEIGASVTADFVGLLRAVFLVHELPAFGRTLSSRISRSPKIHVVDSGVGANLLGLTHRKLADFDASTLTEFGHLVESFVVAEIAKQTSWSDDSIALSHFRNRDGAEVDLVLEAHDGRVVGIEVKSTGKVTDKDFRGLRLLRDKLGDDFVGGVVLHMGQYSYSHDERLYALPIDRLWTV